MDMTEAELRQRMAEQDYELISLPCGCQDVHYADGRVEREHDYVECSGKPLPTPEGA